MPKSPKVSIGMPIFNGDNFVGSAIESILAQTFSDFELIVSDNGSTDDTRQICERYASLDSRIRYLRHDQNVGAIANFNSLVALARGLYFKWAAHDDVCASAYLERCVEILDSRPEVVWCHCDSDMIDAAGKSWLERMPANDEEIELDGSGKRRWAGLPRIDHDDPRPSKRFAGVLMGTRWCVDSYGLIRIDALHKSGLYPSIYGSEKVLIGELSLMGPTHQVNECLFQQRIHPAASAYQDDVAKQQQFVRADSTKPFASTRFALFQAHLAVVRRAEVSRWQKFMCYIAILRYATQARKWIRVMGRRMHGKGVGGGGRRIIEAGSQHTEQLPSGASQ
ncbi:glycosyltransferase family 2 protein [Neorhodopirellula pilleata]|uniref:Putative glycosyltransferase EpsJ n=1 Tax=Neorhodopirellula pilleata TaxID=2714738 RepID=A0A5C6AAT3_9BACT|nr:glycosyltransferase family 2 protein [Neorhodopirellula pilleata]TWT96477.1 putative glycosyltransferase EpsJ [Neorhodopirellula pilleata]